MGRNNRKKNKNITLVPEKKESDKEKLERLFSEGDRDSIHKMCIELLEENQAVDKIQLENDDLTEESLNLATKLEEKKTKFASISKANEMIKSKVAQIDKKTEEVNTSFKEEREEIIKHYEQLLKKEQERYTEVYNLRVAALKEGDGLKTKYNQEIDENKNFEARITKMVEERDQKRMERQEKLKISATGKLDDLARAGMAVSQKFELLSKEKILLGAKIQQQSEVIANYKELDEKVEEQLKEREKGIKETTAELEGIQREVSDKNTKFILDYERITSLKPKVIESNKKLEVLSKQRKAVESLIASLKQK